jgi:hypothetical protein
VRRTLSMFGCLCLALWCACHSGASPTDVSPSGAGDDVAATRVACDDGTGATDCCPNGTVAGGNCSAGNSICYSRCVFADDASTQGTRNEFSCPGGTWLAGHGLFPCMRQ